MKFTSVNKETHLKRVKEAICPRAGNKKKKVKKNIQTGIAHIQATFNNTIITITDLEGNVITWSSAVYKVSRAPEKVPLCCANAAEDAAKKAMEHGVAPLMSMSRVQELEGNRHCDRFKPLFEVHLIKTSHLFP